MKKQLYANTTDEKYTTITGGASKTDKLILEQAMHRYDEECKRFDTVDSKLSSMIGVLATIFTIQTSLFALILNNMGYSSYVIIAYILFVVSEVLYLASAIIFIKAYNFETAYDAMPTPEILQYYYGEKSSKDEIMDDLIKNYSKSIKTNHSNIEKKTAKGKNGFTTLKVGLISSFALIFSLICLKYLI